MPLKLQANNKTKRTQSNIKRVAKPMETTTSNVHDALFNASQEFKPLKKSGKNPHFKNEYSTLDDIREATRDALTKYRLHVSHGVKVTAEISSLVTTIRHIDSNTLIESEFFIENEAPQKMGSAMTYGRRYNLVNLLDLIADPDDDGESYYGRSGGGSTKSEGGEKKQRRGGLGGRLS